MAVSQEIHFMICNAGFEAVSCRFKLAAGCDNEASAEAPGPVVDRDKVMEPLHWHMHPYSLGTRCCSAPWLHSFVCHRHCASAVHLCLCITCRGEYRGDLTKAEACAVVTVKMTLSPSPNRLPHLLQSLQMAMGLSQRQAMAQASATHGEGLCTVQCTSADFAYLRCLASLPIRIAAISNS
jgi:hypothetical protein